ncbi:hypothetical protein BRC64_09670 [Halobacteriales archaeon QH_10_67_22]|nr:MAG: hypothetical protein BRC64_09670 [Halobacteriales archaeon QH_10_67_22]
MRYKVVPEPHGLDTLRAAHAAVALVPDSVEDCCTRIVDRTAIPSRDAAREWLTFLQALELVRETPQGFERVRTDPDRERLAEAFERRVFGARELLAALDDATVTADEAFEHLRPAVGEWERQRHTDWTAEWRERSRRLLAWAETFGLVAREDDRYRAAERE